MPVDNEKVNSLAVDVLNLSRNTLIINLRFMDKAISMLNYKSISELDGFAVDGTTIYFRPVLYLTSNIVITSGDGTESNPYNFSL